jgi:hypothetical protein
MSTNCIDASAFYNLVTQKCSEPKSEECALAISRGIDAYGDACMQLPIAPARPDLPPFGAYVCGRDLTASTRPQLRYLAERCRTATPPNPTGVQVSSQPGSGSSTGLLAGGAITAIAGAAGAAKLVSQHKEIAVMQGQVDRATGAADDSAALIADLREKVDRATGAADDDAALIADLREKVDRATGAADDDAALIADLQGQVDHAAGVGPSNRADEDPSGAGSPIEERVDPVSMRAYENALTTYERHVCRVNPLTCIPSQNVKDGVIRTAIERVQGQFALLPAPEKLLRQEWVDKSVTAEIRGHGGNWRRRHGRLREHEEQAITFTDTQIQRYNDASICQAIPLACAELPPPVDGAPYTQDVLDMAEALKQTQDVFRELPLGDKMKQHKEMFADVPVNAHTRKMIEHGRKMTSKKYGYQIADITL